MEKAVKCWPIFCIRPRVSVRGPKGQSPIRAHIWHNISSDDQLLNQIGGLDARAMRHLEMAGNSLWPKTLAISKRLLVFKHVKDYFEHFSCNDHLGCLFPNEVGNESLYI